MKIALVILFLIILGTIIIPLKENNKKFMFYLFGCVLFCFATFRGMGIDKDYGNYLNMYNLSYTLTWKNVEWSFLLIIKGVKYLFHNPVFLFGIYALLGVLFKFIAIKQLSEFWILSVLIYLSNFFLLHEMTQIRIGVASGLMLLSIKPVYDRNLKKFLFFAILSFCFHYAAIITVLFWFLQAEKMDKIYLYLIPIGYICYFCNISLYSLLNQLPIDLFQDKLQRNELEFLLNGSKTNIFNIQQILRCILVYVFIWKSKIIEDANKYFYILLKCYIFSLFVFLMLHDLSFFAYRISEFLGVVEIILIPCLYYVFKQKQMATAVVCSIGLCFFLLNLFYIKLIL